MEGEEEALSGEGMPEPPVSRAIRVLALADGGTKELQDGNKLGV